MGTRADFYIKEKEKLTWLGSIAWDGNPGSVAPELLSAKTQAGFAKQLEKFLAPREDTTMPEQGWPWPWNDSRTTDYAYAFDVEKGGVLCSSFGKAWRAVPNPLPTDDTCDEEKWKTAGKPKFPDMKGIQKVTMGKRSGIMVIGPGGPVEGLD